MTDSATALGIDVGGTNLRIAEIDAAGRILSRHAERVTNGRDAFSNRLAELVATHRSPNVAAIGIGIPGRVDAAAGLVLSAGYLDIGGLPLAGWLGTATRLPVVVENDCSMALIGECAVGAARGAENVVMFTIGTGIGGAIIQGGRPLHGHATAGQLGHITVRPGGERCNCGRQGCVETTSSGTSLGRLIREAGLATDTTVQGLFARSDAGDDVATAVLRAWAEPMRDAATSMAAAFDPDLVVFGGGLGGAMVRALGRLPPETSWYNYDIRPAALGDDAGIIGGGLWALASLRRGKAPQASLPAFAAEAGHLPVFNPQP
ncbi:ROK family protein [Pleomorphomonas sp. NRK KF1]|uniref:ROK family protein n=1 Tax=Pleomorphomonas sp. NRK KF1 TaxID=2943000 RepID=UPI002044946D|nr:ROK family protein [Pleomorphomonas sp. NRK KF1]MCM5555098.1 ROK family protein [Pleomorphomonas sp. NRK KF1]